MVTDPLLTVIGGPIAILLPGEEDTTTFTGTYAITQDDIDAGVFVNQATATGTPPTGSDVSDLSDDDSYLENDPTETYLCSARIALIKAGTWNDENQNGCADVGEAINYTFSVKNTGNVDLSNVMVTDPLLTVIGGPIDLAVGEEDNTNFTGSYTIIQDDIDAGEFENQAEASGTPPTGSDVTDLSDDDSYLEDDPTITALPSDDCPDCDLTMELKKTGVWIDENNNGSADVGEVIEYTFSVTNTTCDRPFGTIYNITIEDPLPGLIIEGGPIESLAPGETDDTTFTATYVITEGCPDPIIEVTNQASASGEGINGEIVEDLLSDDPSTEAPNDPTVVFLDWVCGIDWEIFNGVTPNEDTFNDYFKIIGIQDYPNNNVKIYNRWGILIWEINGYETFRETRRIAPVRSFTGNADGWMMLEGNNAPTGTYFYVITLFGDGPFPEGGRTKFSGYLYLNR